MPRRRPIYGARGAFGVVLVTTKSRPKRGAPESQLTTAVRSPSTRRTVESTSVVTDGLTNGSTGWIGRVERLLQRLENPLLSLHRQHRRPIRMAGTIRSWSRRQRRPVARTRDASTSEGDSMFGWAYMRVDRLAGRCSTRTGTYSHEHNLSDFGRQSRMRTIMCRAVSTIMDGIYRVGDESLQDSTTSARQGHRPQSAPGCKVTNNNLDCAVVDQHEPDALSQSPTSPCSARSNHGGHAAQPPVTNPDGSWTDGRRH